MRVQVTAEVLSVLTETPKAPRARAFNVGPLIEDSLHIFYEESLLTYYEDEGGGLKVVVKRGEYAIVLFYGGASFSNFVSNAGALPARVLGSDKEVEIRMPEEFFKLACGLMPGHEKPFDAAAVGKIRQEMERGSQIKASTFDVGGFNAQAWDAVSQQYMLAAQFHRMTNPACFDTMKRLAHLNVPEVRFVEATNNDRKWGSGINADEMVQHLMRLQLSRDDAFAYITSKGTNMLGSALDSVMSHLKSIDFDYEAFVVPPLFELV
jgi:predicted NAD-dependent protein-ADP-ribosyltransferase YbiA (DUF1768 family)